MSDFQDYLSGYFHKLLKAHDLQATHYNGWVAVDGDFPAFRAFYERPLTENQCGTLTIQIMLEEASLVEECFAAIGESDIDAINGALEQFAMTMLHPIISGCCSHVDEEQVTKEIWPLKMFTKAEIWSGNIALRVSVDVKVNTPIDWLTHISNELKKTSVEKGYNWITLYCSRLNSDSLIASASLNNKDWPAGLKATTKLSWPEIDGFYGARLFILVKR